MKEESTNALKENTIIQSKSKEKTNNYLMISQLGKSSKKGK